VVVGFAGGLKLWHGIETLVRGLELALQGGARMRLEVLGTGPAEDVLDRVALPDDRLRRLGHLPHADALDVLERWDVGVAPFSAVEGFYFSPLKLFEYMAAGLCPVVSEVGELAEIVEHGRAGVLVPPDDATALAQALSSLDRDRERLRELGARAQLVARSRPSWSDNARRAVAALEGLGSGIATVEARRR
jgi:glycosyltransferase involved in cell wall biosynthesis